MRFVLFSALLACSCCFLRFLSVSLFGLGLWSTTQQQQAAAATADEAAAVSTCLKLHSLRPFWEAPRKAGADVSLLHQISAAHTHTQLPTHSHYPLNSTLYSFNCAANEFIRFTDSFIHSRLRTMLLHGSATLQCSAVQWNTVGRPALRPCSSHFQLNSVSISFQLLLFLHFPLLL